MKNIAISLSLLFYFIAMVYSLYKFCTGDTLTAIYYLVYSVVFLILRKEIKDL